MFAKEAELLSELKHPNIVRLYEFDRDGDIVYIVMDWVEGENVRQVVVKKKQPLPLTEVARILDPVCSALNFAHQSNVYHCDVKPANIMLHDDGRVLLTDFGVARHAADATWGGTPAYMAPEQFPELPYAGKVDARTDVYALGVSIYEMLSGGWVPYRGDTPNLQGQKTRERIVWEIVNTPLTPLKHYNNTIPDALDNVVRTALNTDPALRYSTTIELRDAFDYARKMQPRRQTGPKTKLFPVPKPGTSMAPKPSPLPSQQSPPPQTPRASPPSVHSMGPSPIPGQSGQLKGPYLYGRTGEWAGKMFEITRNGLTIGRHSRSQLRLREPSVSREHASLTRKRWGKDVFIRDENSSLGVVVNNQLIPVAAAIKLRHGDIIQIGHFQVFEFKER